MGKMTVTWGPMNLKFPQVPMRDKINQLQKKLSGLPQYQVETEHFFHGGMYCRKVFRHKGVLIIGKVHKKEHFYVVAKGKIAVTDGENQPIEYSEGDVICSLPGTKRAVVALEDSICMTFHVVESSTIEDAENELVEDDPDSTMTIGNKIKREYLS